MTRGHSPVPPKYATAADGAVHGVSTTGGMSRPESGG